MNIKDLEELKGAKLVDYIYEENGIDNIHIFLFDNGMKLQFYHEDYEGTVEIVRNE